MNISDDLTPSYGSTHGVAVRGAAGTWETRGRDYRVRYGALVSARLSPSHFEGRGAYGDFFAGQVQVQGGF